ncbi:MAG: (2Fe-2S)-binding protein [Halanaerobiales bacterium]
MDDSTIICRCEDITLGELRQMIKEGFTTLDEIKRISRLGMGPCRGSTCLTLAAREIARLTDKKIEDIKMPTNRPPLSGIKLSELAGEVDDRG